MKRYRVGLVSIVVLAFIYACSGRVDDRSTFGPTGPVTTNPDSRGQITDRSYVRGDCERRDSGVFWYCPNGYECVYLGSFGVTGTNCPDLEGSCPVCARPNVHEVLVCNDRWKQVGVQFSYPATYVCNPKS